MPQSTNANLGFEDHLWQAAERLRGSMDAAEYKHVVLGLIFLKYISDAFGEKYESLATEIGASGTQDKDEYLAENIHFIPEEASWRYLKDKARSPEIGTLIDKAMHAIEKESPVFKGVLPKGYARPELDKQRLGGVIDLISNISLGDKESREQDIIGRVYEYFLGRFAEKEGKGGGEFYTPSCVVRLLVEMLQPYQGRVFDPCCGSGGMFVQAAKFIAAHASGNGNGGKAKREISVYGQESNHTTWRLCRMNLAIRGIDGDIQFGDSLLSDQHKDLKADFVIANPPFNMEDWGYSRVKDDVRWRYFDTAPSGALFSLPPGGERRRNDGTTRIVDGGNANYAWILHFHHHLAPHGIAGFVLANGSLTSNTSGEGEIRKAIIAADRVDCIIALPTQLFYTTQIPVCLWFLTRDKGVNNARNLRDRQGETLFIDARGCGKMIDRTHREITSEEITEIADTYHAWRSGGSAYEDVAGFCKSAALEEIEGHDYVLTPGRYVGAVEIEGDGVPFEEKVTKLSTALLEQMEEGRVLDERIQGNLGVFGYGE